MSPTVAIVVYCGLIVGASLAGGWLPSLVRLTHTGLQLTMSFVAGLMLGVALLHLLPRSVEMTRNAEVTAAWLIVGVLVMFFLVRTFHFHHHGPGEPSAGTEHEHAHQHGHSHGRNHAHEPHGAHRLSWIGVATGLSLHTAIDGVALAADVVSHTGGPGWFLGLGTFLAILLHKPLDALSITSLMAAGGWSIRSRQAINLGFALMCPLGAALFAAGFSGQSREIGCALAFAAGVFLCIALDDVLPEVQFHTHDRFKLSFALLLGVALAYAIHTLEHDHRSPPTSTFTTRSVSEDSN